MSDLSVIGAGQLGSRHLQALARLDGGRIWVVEPNADNVSRAKSRWDEVATSSSPTVTYADAISALPVTLDVAIVATSANVRRAVVDELLRRTRVPQLVLEKILFQDIEDYAAVGQLLAQTQTTAWVNCPRRAWAFYADLKARITGPVQVSVTGSKWGLGSNALHFLDLFAYLGGDDALSIDALRVQQVTSVRAGFSELTGDLAGHSASGSVSIACLPDGNLPVVVDVTSPTLRAIVREGESKAWVSEASRDWEWREETIEIIPQSRLSDRLVTDLVTTGRSVITPYASSTQHHLAFLRSLSTALGVSRCPIT